MGNADAEGEYTSYFKTYKTHTNVCMYLHVCVCVRVCGTRILSAQKSFFTV